MAAFQREVGSVIGPILVAALVTEFGFVEGLTVVGIYLVILSFLLLTTYAGLPRRTPEWKSRPA